VPASEPVPEAPYLDDADWWDRVWRVHLRERTERSWQAGEHRARPPLELVGRFTDLLRRAEPDSATAAALARLFLADDFSLDGLRGFLLARGYALDVADRISREAAMFDEHLGTTIMAPDTPDDKERAARPARR
jgi:hypothetical protein